MRYILFLLVFPFASIGQVDTTDLNFEESFEARYERNIRKSRIDGVYIPKDLYDAFSELLELSSTESIEKFKTGDELTVAKKLHFGIGRWMIYNWNFYDGSRFSHYLKEMGLSHPDDMAQFVLRTFHRHLNKRDLGVKELVEFYKKEREKIRLEKVQEEIIPKKTKQE